MILSREKKWSLISEREKMDKENVRTPKRSSFISSKAEYIAKLLLEARAITLNPAQPYTFASGIKSPIYCDNRLLISHPDERKKIVDAFVKLIKQNKLKFDVVCGTATAGIPWAAWIAEKLGMPMIYVRKASKEHGKQNVIEGKLAKGDNVLVVEDLISTGGSSVGAILNVKEAGGIVNDCIAIFTYEMDTAVKAFDNINCPCHTLTDFTTLIDVATDNDYIGESEKEKVLEWNKNPEEWGKEGN